MLFSSIIFLFKFLPLTLLLYYIVPERFKNTVLLVCSLLFYAWGEPVYIFLMLFSITFNYVSGLELASVKEDRNVAKRKLVFNIAVNIGVLGFFKYYGFLMESLSTLLRVDIPYRELALPIGISFYTFQALSYVIDVYWGKVEAQRNYISFAVYVTMFPQLIAGPIVQYKDVERQLRKRSISVMNFGAGALFFISGLAKKVLLANTAGMIFTTVEGLGKGEMSVLTAWLGCLAYAFQIYFDFGGYSDMAIGLGKMFGFQFLENFDYPYMSKSITEFWRRWHISLGSWFREYVYIPLGGNRVEPAKHIRNILVVWILTGLWHGASWNFVVWGLYYGLLLLLEKYVFRDLPERLPAAVRHLYTLFFVALGWVFFFSPGLKEAVGYIGVMFGVGSRGFADRQAMYLLVSNTAWWIIFALCSTPFVHRTLNIRLLSRNYEKLKDIVYCAVYGVVFLLCIAYLVTETYNPFLYFRF